MIALRKPNRFLPASVALGVYFAFFYFKYVPLVPGFQVLVLASGLTVLVLARPSPRGGNARFSFRLSPFNALPYFFRIDESVPHAPAALVLFLFFALGRLAGRSFGPRPPRPPSNPLGPAMRFFAGLVILSAAISLWRFAGFIPFAADRLYEFPVNVNGVSAGGARMSVVFAALNILSGMGFYVLLRPLMRDARFRMKAVSAMAAALLVASAAGLVQKLVDPGLGNTAFWVKMGQINGTFKDPNAFATVLSLFIPLLAAAFFRRPGRRRLFFGAAALASLAIFPFIGARSPLLGLGAGLVWVLVAAAAEWRRSGGKLGKPALAGIVVVLAAAVGLGAFAAQRTRLFERLAANVSALAKGGGLVGISPERYFLWREALAMASDHPISGVGMGAYIVELPNYYAADASASKTALEGWKRNDSAENLPLQIGAELGVIGLIGFLWLLGAIVGLAGGSWPGRPTIRVPARPTGSFLSPRRRVSFPSVSMPSSIPMSGASRRPMLSGSWPHSCLPGTGRARLRPAENGDWPAYAAIGLILFAAVLFRDAGRSLSPGERWKTYSIPPAFGLYKAEKTADGREYNWTREYGAFPVPAGAGRIVRPDPRRPSGYRRPAGRCRAHPGRWIFPRPSPPGGRPAPG